MNEDITNIYSATLADLYLEQGYIEKAIEIYEFLVKREPKNEKYKKRLEYLKKNAEKRPSILRELIKKIW